MKLSKLTTDEALDVLCEITPYVSNIVSDETLMETLNKTIKKDGMTRAGVLVAGAEKLSRLVPIVMKEHRNDVYGILAAVNGLDVEEIAKQNIIKTSMQIRDVCADKEMLDFFRSCAQQKDTE